MFYSHISQTEAKELLEKHLQECKITDFQSLNEEKFKNFLQVIENGYYTLEENSHKLEHSLSHSRYEGMAEMIGNIAHQWRQPLSAITSLATGMKLKMELGIDTPNEYPDTLNQILGQATYLNQTIYDFSGFLRSNGGQKDFNLLEILLITLGIVEKSFSDNHIKLYMKDYTFKEKCFGLSNEVSQVLLNLLSNAKDALIDSKHQNKAVYVDMSEDEIFNIITIVDNGGGIPLDIIDKIFDPYFTTKHQFVGTGIGLYASKDIIENNMNGSLIAKNIDEVIDGIHFKGASFSVFIPKAFHN